MTDGLPQVRITARSWAILRLSTSAEMLRGTAGVVTLSSAAFSLDTSPPFAADVRILEVARRWPAHRGDVDEVEKSRGLDREQLAMVGQFFVGPVRVDQGVL